MHKTDTPEKVASTDQLGQMVKAWYCVYSSGQEFVSLVEYPMNDPNVRECWRLFSMAERDDAVAVEHERCVGIADHVAKICLHPDEIAEAIRTGLIPELGPTTEG